MWLSIALQAAAAGTAEVTVDPHPKLDDQVVLYAVHGQVPAPRAQTIWHYGLHLNVGARPGLDVEFAAGWWRHRPSACERVPRSEACSPPSTPYRQADLRVVPTLLDYPVDVFNRPWRARLDAVLGAGLVDSRDVDANQRCEGRPAEECGRGGTLHTAVVVGSAVVVAPKSAIRYRLGLDYRWYTDADRERLPGAGHTWMVSLGVGVAMSTGRDRAPERPPIRDL